MIGENIKTLREKAGYTQERLAEMVGCARANIAMFERGSKNPSLNLAKEIAKVFGVTVDELLQ